MIYLLDTDHISLMNRGGPTGERISARVATMPAQVYVSIVSYEEQSRGWLAETAKARSNLSSNRAMRN